MIHCLENIVDLVDLLRTKVMDPRWIVSTDVFAIN